MSTVEPLIIALKDAGASVLRHVARALGEIKGVLIQPLIAALSDQGSWVCQSVSDGLRDVGVPAVVRLIGGP